MTEGIKSINIDETEKVEDPNLGLPYEDLPSDTSKDPSEMFLSPRESRGLEAAAFATIIGQAPTTGNLVGDFFSTLAQSGPASLAAYKERLNVKEKEAEYKSKQESLAGKLNNVHVVDTFADDISVQLLPETFVARQNQMTPGRFFFAPQGNLSSNPVDNAVYASGPLQGKPAEIGSIAFNIDAEKYKRDPDNYVRKYRIDDYEEADLYWEDAPPGTPIVERIRRGVNFTEWKKLSPDDKTKKGWIKGIPEKAEAELVDLQKQQTQQSNKQLAIAERLSGVKGLINIMNKTGAEFAKGGIPGTAGKIFKGVNEISAFLGEGMSAVRQFINKDGDKSDQEISMIEKRGLRQAENEIRGYLVKKVKDSGIKSLTRNEEKVYRYFTGKLSGTEQAKISTQAMVSNVTQFAYLLAKSRESGGKFSVPDIQMALSSVGADSNDIFIILSGMQNIIDQQVEQIVAETEDAYYNPITKKATNYKELYADDRLRPYQDVFRYYNDNITDTPYDSLPKTNKDDPYGSKAFWDNNYKGSTYKPYTPVDIPAEENQNKSDKDAFILGGSDLEENVSGLGK